MFAPGDELAILVRNLSSKDLHVEPIGTAAGEGKVILAPSTTVLKASQTFRFPESGTIRVRAGLGKEQVTVFASDVPFALGELLRGDRVADRVVHRFEPGGKHAPRDLDPSRLRKRTIEIETR